MDLDRRARWLTRTLDGALSVAVLLLGLVRDAGRISPEPQEVVAPYAVDLPPWALVACHVVGASLLLLRRNRPVTVTLGLAALAVVTPVVAALVMPYSVARYLPGLHRSLPLCGLLFLGVFTGAGHWAVLVHRDWAAGDPLTPLLLMTALTAAGLYLGARADLLTQYRARAEGAERESSLRAARERLQDRAALALVLHDVGSHWVTLMTMQAGALSVQATDPAVRAEVEDLRVKGERALTELHRLIGVLSSGEEDTELAGAPPHARAELGVLVAECSPGLAVDFREEGRPAGVPEDVVVLLRRVLVEGLLNAVKHAAGGSAEVTVRWQTGQVDGVVVSRPRRQPGRSPTPGVGSRLGLTALAARCAESGGWARSEARDDGTFVLRAQLPYRGSA